MKSNALGALAIMALAGVANAQLAPSGGAMVPTAASLGFTPLNPAKGTSADVANAATARGNLNVRLVSPLDYGALCNGSNNNTTALQSAISSLSAGSVLRITNSCQFSAPLKFPTVNSVKIVADGTLTYIGPATPAGASFTGSISGSTLTITSAVTGTIQKGAYLAGSGIGEYVMVVSGSGDHLDPVAAGRDGLVRGHVTVRPADHDWDAEQWLFELDNSEP